MAESKPQVNKRNFFLGRSAFNVWNLADVPVGTPCAALLESSYWAHVARDLRQYDEIRAIAEDGSFYVWLLVLEVGQNFAKVVPLHRYDFTQEQLLNITIPDGYSIDLRGPKKWSVLRGTEVLKEGLTKKDAEQWLTDHLKITKVKAA